jgi:hypothetical protein
MLVLDSNEYWFEIIKSDSPKQAFETMVEQIYCWNEFENKDSFVPKRYQLLSSPQEPLEDKHVASYIESISNKKIRNNYVGCLFLIDQRYIFYRKKNE